MVVYVFILAISLLGLVMEGYGDKPTRLKNTTFVISAFNWTQNWHQLHHYYFLVHFIFLKRKEGGKMETD